MEEMIKNYIASSSVDRQSMLVQIAEVIEAAIPQAVQRIAWKMPTYTIGKTDIIHFSLQKKFVTLHIGLAAVNFFKDRLANYSTTKGTFHLKFTDEVPVELINDIIRYNLLLLEGEG